eukprot:SAG31_NODE_520_length_14616_cov_8.879005_9_plen_69_part_00
MYLGTVVRALGAIHSTAVCMPRTRAVGLDLQQGRGSDPDPGRPRNLNASERSGGPRRVQYTYRVAHAG